MKHICSRTFPVSSAITLEKAIEVVNMSKMISSSLFFCKHGITLQAKQLPHIVSFFLTLKEGEQFLMIAEGQDAESAMERIQEHFLAG